MLNQTVDLTTDIIHNLVGELTHGESERWVQSATEEIKHHGGTISVSLKRMDQTPSTKRKVCQNLYIDESENQLYTNVPVEEEGVGQFRSWPVRWHMSVKHININMNLLTQNSSQGSDCNTYKNKKQFI